MRKTGRFDLLTIIFGGLLGLILIISLLLYIFDSPKQMQRKFRFPQELTLKMTGEERNVVFSGDREKNIRAYVDDLLLGPASLRMQEIFPEGTRLYQIKLLNKQLYLDFSGDLVFKLENHPLELVEIKNLLVDNLSVNFPFLEKIIITVNGLEPSFGIEE